MNERAVQLPSGGVAYVYDVVPHSAATVIRKHYMRMNRFMGPVRDLDGNIGRDYRNDLTPEQMDEKDALILETEGLYVRTMTLRWEGVTDPSGEALTFPDDVDRMQERDFLVLANTLIAPRADPNAGGPQSESSPEPESSPTTPSSPKTSARS